MNQKEKQINELAKEIKYWEDFRKRTQAEGTLTSKISSLRKEMLELNPDYVVGGNK